MTGGCVAAARAVRRRRRRRAARTRQRGRLARWPLHRGALTRMTATRYHPAPPESHADAHYSALPLSRPALSSLPSIPFHFPPTITFISPHPIRLLLLLFHPDFILCLSPYSPYLSLTLNLCSSLPSPPQLTCPTHPPTPTTTLFSATPLPLRSRRVTG